FARRRVHISARAYFIIVLIALASTLLPTNAGMALTLGSLAPPNLGSCSSCNMFQRQTEPGQPLYRIPPGNWIITSWSSQGGGSADGNARFRVYRPTRVNGPFSLRQANT